MATKEILHPVDPQIAKRLEYFINTYLKDHSQREVAHKLGITQPGISLMINAKRAVSHTVTTKLMKEFRLNPKWLATGDPNEHPISKPSPDSPTLMGQGIKELRQEVIDLKSTIMQMQRAISMMEANQTFFIKRIEQFVKEQQK